MSKYEKLWIYISKKNENDLIITFKEIEKILGFSIDHSFLSYKKELLDYGYEIKHISMKESKIFVVRK